MFFYFRGVCLLLGVSFFWGYQKPFQCYISRPSYNSCFPFSPLFLAAQLIIFHLIHHIVQDVMDHKKDGCSWCPVSKPRLLIAVVVGWPSLLSIFLPPPYVCCRNQSCLCYVTTAQVFSLDPVVHFPHYSLPSLPSYHFHVYLYIIFFPFFPFFPLTLSLGNIWRPWSTRGEL